MTRLLPVEYGAVTSTSVIGGLVIYQEHKFVSSSDLACMGLGVLLICLGCALVGRRKTIKRRYMPGHVVSERCMPFMWLTTDRALKGMQTQASLVKPPTCYPIRCVSSTCHEAPKPILRSGLLSAFLFHGDAPFSPTVGSCDPESRGRC